MRTSPDSEDRHWLTVDDFGGIMQEVDNQQSLAVRDVERLF